MQLNARAQKKDLSKIEIKLLTSSAYTPQTVDLA